jgi:hypothetical protein
VRRDVKEGGQINQSVKVRLGEFTKEVKARMAAVEAKLS